MLRKVDSKGRTRSEMADHLGVSERTITRMVARGELIREDGAGRENLYYEVFDEFSHARQVAGHETGQSRLASSANIQAGEAAYETARQDTRQDSPVSHFTGDSLAKLVEANASLALTVERLSRQLEEQSKHLHEWRARAETEAHEKVKWRARYHVARGRIEMDDD